MIRCILIDDEPLARKGLEEYIGETGFLQHAGSFDQPLKALELLESGGVDLLFLDIQMPKMTGLEFLRQLQSPPPVILVTAYPQFALESYELEVLDYLVKPVSFERFFLAAQKAKRHHELRRTGRQDNEGFFIKTDNRLVRLHFDEILFVEALQNYVTIHTADKKYITYLTFHAVEEFLPPERFLRTHKSYLVALDKVDSIEGNELRLKGHSVPISRLEKDAVLDRLLKGKFLKR